MTLRRSDLIGSLGVPSPMAMNELRNGRPSTVPRTFTSPRVPKKSTESGMTTKVQPPLLGLFCNAALNCFLNALTSPPSRLAEQSSGFLDDHQTVAVNVAEREHRRHTRPTQHVICVDALRPQRRVVAVSVGGREPPTGLDPGWDPFVGGDERDGRRSRWCHLDPPRIAAHRDVQALLETELVDVELQR